MATPESEEIDLAEGVTISFEEYKMYFETTERVVDRRLSMTRHNTSLSIAMIAGIGAAASWGLSNQSVAIPVFIMLALTSLLAAIFSFWWLQFIKSQKELNSAKFHVLGKMAPRVVFPIELNGAECSNAFDLEWLKLQQENALQKTAWGSALGSNWSEMVVPKGFLALFIASFLGSALVVILVLMG